MQKKILMIGPVNLDSSLFVSTVTKKCQADVLLIQDPEKVLNLLQDQKMNLVIIDMDNPSSVDLQSILKIREQFSSEELPILLTTSNKDLGEVEMYLQSGINDCLQMPMNMDLMTARILTHMNLSQALMALKKMNSMSAFESEHSKYYHDLNNALTIAIGRSLRHSDEVMQTALWKIASLNKLIREISERRKEIFQEYSVNTEHKKQKITGQK